ncbi:hypothetical protein GQ53DRAFT_802343, partial [Thozetella sp. PMI_491]
SSLTISHKSGRSRTILSITSISTTCWGASRTGPNCIRSASSASSRAAGQSAWNVAQTCSQTTDPCRKTASRQSGRRCLPVPERRWARHLR